MLLNRRGCLYTTFEMRLHHSGTKWSLEVNWNLLILSLYILYIMTPFSGKINYISCYFLSSFILLMFTKFFYQNLPKIKIFK